MKENILEKEKAQFKKNYLILSGSRVDFDELMIFGLLMINRKIEKGNYQNHRKSLLASLKQWRKQIA